MFPEPDKDPVIQIANMVINQGEKDPFVRNVFTLGTCAPIVGSQVLSYSTESEMLTVSSPFIAYSSSSSLYPFTPDSAKSKISNWVKLRNKQQ